MSPFEPNKSDFYSKFYLLTTQETTPNPEKYAPTMAKDAHLDKNNKGQLPEASGAEWMDPGAIEQKKLDLWIGLTATKAELTTKWIIFRGYFANNQGQQ